MQLTADPNPKLNANPNQQSVLDLVQLIVLASMRVSLLRGLLQPPMSLGQTVFQPLHERLRHGTIPALIHGLGLDAFGSGPLIG